MWSVYNAHMLLAAFLDSHALRGAIMGLDNLLALLGVGMDWATRACSP